MIVALARKLLVALWRYVKDGVIPEGAKMKDGIRRVSIFASIPVNGWRSPQKTEDPWRVPLVKNGPPQANSLLPNAGIVVWDRKIPPDTRLAGSASCLTNRSSLRPEFCKLTSPPRQGRCSEKPPRKENQKICSNKPDRFLTPASISHSRQEDYADGAVEV